ncbi:hypothetical protein [Streptomyces sp. NPDC058751]|uniref:hypothetical protein n=1 Tax=Streptomyces sp. NPDC058751 TaxID=3346623 RepID=UPI003690B3E0
MAVMEVCNDNTGLLVLWLEPLGEDRWLEPGEAFRVRSDYDGDELAFSVTCWADEEDRAAGIENVTVWVEAGDWDAQVTDRSGNVIECGHHRPEEIDRRWTERAEEARGRVEERERQNLS